MVNRELLEYVQNQFQLGVSKEEVARALLASGWPQDDVREVLGMKPATPVVQAAPTVIPITTAPSAVKAVVSDMVTSPPAVAPIRPAAAEAYFQKKEVVPAALPVTQKTPIQEPTFVRRENPALGQTSTGGVVLMSSGKKFAWKKWLIWGGGGVLVIGCIAGIAMFFMGRGASSEEIANLQDDKDNLSLQISALARDKDNLNNQMVALQAQAQLLKEELAILATPNVSATSTVVVTVKGTLRVDDKGQYRVETPNYLLIFVKNNKDTALVNLLKPNIDKQIVLDGTHLPGVSNITVTAVNGVKLDAGTAPVTPVAPTPPPAAPEAAPAPVPATTTPTSTPVAATTTPTTTAPSSGLP